MSDFIDSIIEEGVTKNDDKYNFDFKNDDPNDILSLRFKPARKSGKKSGNTSYSYYYAYQLKKSDLSGELMKAIKSLDGSIDENSMRMFVNKAVMGFYKQFGNKFDTIVTPVSSSKVLTEVANQLHDKMGDNVVMFPGAFVKTANTDIEFDTEKVNALPDKSKGQFMKVLNKIKLSDKPFKMKEVFSPYRKFITNFIKFNSNNDRKLMNAVTGKDVILIDDYKTTGTTLKEMLSQLINAGAKTVAVFIILKVE